MNEERTYKQLADIKYMCISVILSVVQIHHDKNYGITKITQSAIIVHISKKEKTNINKIQKHKNKKHERKCEDQKSLRT